MSDSRNIQRAAPVLWAADLKASIEFWEERLGFPCSFREGDPEDPIYAIVQRDGVEVHLSPRHPEWAGHGSFHLLVLDADALYSEFRARGVESMSEIEDREYGMRAFYLADNDGNFVEFGHNL